MLLALWLFEQVEVLHGWYLRTEFFFFFVSLSERVLIFGCLSGRATTVVIHSDKNFVVIFRLIFLILSSSLFSCYYYYYFFTCSLRSDKIIA